MTETKRFLQCGAIAGPMYVVVSLAQAALRDGFDPTRHAWSLLANGAYGWIHVANLAITGALTIAFAIGLRRTTSRAAARLVAIYGVGLVLAAIFEADPALGFPPGTEATVTMHGILHFACAGIGFLAIVAATFVLARRYAAARRVAWAWISRAIGSTFLLGFFAIGSGAGGVAANLAFTACVIALCGWMSAVALERYRSV